MGYPLQANLKQTYAFFQEKVYENDICLVALGPVALRLVTLQFKYIVTDTQK